MQINYHLNWKSHINLILPNVYAASFALRWLFYVLNIDAVWIADVTYFRSMIKYGIILRGNSTNTGQGFLSQKRIIKTIVGVGCTNLCMGIFRKLHILPVPCYVCFHLLCLFLIILRVFRLTHQYLEWIQKKKTHWHRPIAKLSCFQKGVSYSCIKNL